MHELGYAEMIEELPYGKHSVKGVGEIEPDPQHTKVLPSGVCVPLGKGVHMNRHDSTSLIYNEYPLIAILILSLQVFKG